MERILDRMKKSPLVFDGAMGTMIYERGVFINTCFDELSLSNPKLISQIHREYVEAGAEVIETYTFGANRIALRPYGLSEKVVEINRQAVRIAREAAGDSVYVAGAVGPCIRPDQIMPDEHAVEGGETGGRHRRGASRRRERGRRRDQLRYRPRRGLRRTAIRSPPGRKARRRDAQRGVPPRRRRPSALPSQSGIFHRVRQEIHRAWRAGRP